LPRRVQERQEKWTSGEILASEPQRIPLTALSKIENWDTTIDGALEAAPGYATEFSIPLSRQLADMEDTESWVGDAVANKTDKEYGFQSQDHVHGAANTKTSTFTRSLGFIGDDFVDADIMHFWFRHTVLANVTTVEVRFRVDAANYFSRTFALAGGDPAETTFDVARSTFSATGSPDWSTIADIRVITTSSGGVTISFDNFNILVADTTIQDPSTGILGFDQIANSERFLMAANSDAIYSAEGTTITRRDSKLTLKRMVHMIVANDQVFAVNGLDNPKNWVTSEAVFRDVGVPSPTDTPAGAEGGAGNVAADTYFAKTVFDMGVHGEGNGSPASAAIVIFSADKSIDYTNIEIGPARTVQRIIYRTRSGSTAIGPFFLDKIITNNTATTITSQNSDAQLGIQLVENANKPPAGNYIAFSNRTLFMAGITGAQSSVRFSDTTRAANRTIEQWPALNEFKLNRDDGDRIVGLINHGRFIYVFKTRSTWIIDPLSLATPTQISSIYGTVSQRSLSVIGNVLYAWSAFFGPLEIRGTSIVPIGIGEKNRDREGPGVLDVNSNPISTTLNGIIISTTPEFKEGVSVFVNTNADDEPGKIVLDRTTASAPSIQDNQATKGGASISHTIPTDEGNIQNIGNARDGDDDTFASIRSITTVKNLSGELQIDLGSSKKINKVRLRLGQNDLTDFISITNVVLTRNINRVEFQKQNGSWELLASFEWPSTGRTGLTFSFPTVTAQKFRIRLDIRISEISNSDKLALLVAGRNDLNSFIDFNLFEFLIFPAGFLNSGTWTSDEIDLEATPAEWGRLTSDFVTPAGSSLVVKMKSAISAVLLGNEVFTTQILGQAPNVVERQFVQFEVSFSSNGIRTPELEDIALTFISVAKGIIQPQFETCGIFFEDRYWLNAVKADSQKPTTMWKYDTNNRAFSRHTDYAMSDWTFLGTALFSSTSEDGAIIRHVIDINRKRIGDKDGRVIPCSFETADSALGDQSIGKSVRSIIVAARNEAVNRENFVVNPDLEDWTDNVPDGWFVVGDDGLFGGNRVFQETDPRNILSGFSSAKIDFQDPSAVDLSTGFIISGRFLNDTDYVITFNAKVLNGSPTIIKLEASTPPAAGIFLQDNGSWTATDNQLNDGFVFEDRMKKFVLAFKTPSNIESFSQVKVSFGYLQNSSRGVLYLDDVAIYESSTKISRTLKILPFLDDVAFGTEFSMNLVGGDQSTVDLGVRQERFFIDRSLKRNARFRVTHEEDESLAKVLGLFIDYAPEKFRNSALIRA